VRERFGNIHLVGTAHIWEQSVQEVRSVIEEVDPSVVAVELCARRFESLTDPEKWDDTPLTDLIRDNKGYMLMAQVILSTLQKELGAETGTAPGAEMLEAVRIAEERGAEVLLADRDITVTLKRAWSAMSSFERMGVVWDMMKGLFLVVEEEKEEVKSDESDTGDDTENSDEGEMKAEGVEAQGDTEGDVGGPEDERAVEPEASGKEGVNDYLERMLEDGDLISQMMDELRKLAPHATQALIDERDAYLALKLASVPEEKTVVAVVGAGHMKGILSWLGRLRPDVVVGSPVVVTTPDDAIGPDVVNVPGGGDDTDTVDVPDVGKDVSPVEDADEPEYHSYREPRLGIMALGIILALLSLRGVISYDTGWISGSSLEWLLPGFSGQEVATFEHVTLMLGVALVVVGYLLKRTKLIRNLRAVSLDDLGLPALEELPPPGFPTGLALGYSILGIFILLFTKVIWEGRTEVAAEAFLWWFLINGVLSALGVALVRGHPYSILAAFCAAPFTSLNPTVAAGWVSGLVEAKVRTPTVGDLKPIETFSDMWHNKAFRVLLVAAMGNLGSIIGTYWGLAHIISVIGL